MVSKGQLKVNLLSPSYNRLSKQHISPIILQAFQYCIKGGK